VKILRNLPLEASDVTSVVLHSHKRNLSVQNEVWPRMSYAAGGSLVS